MKAERYKRVNPGDGMIWENDGSIIDPENGKVMGVQGNGESYIPPSHYKLKTTHKKKKHHNLHQRYERGMPFPTVAEEELDYRLRRSERM